MGYKLDLLQPKEDVFWHLTYSRSETNKAWKISLDVINFAYLHTTYILSVLILSLNLTWTKYWIYSTWSNEICVFASNIGFICSD